MQVRFSVFFSLGAELFAFGSGSLRCDLSACQKKIKCIVDDIVSATDQTLASCFAQTRREVGEKGYQKYALTTCTAPSNKSLLVGGPLQSSGRTT